VTAGPYPTRSGADQFHRSASDYFNYQKMFASQHSWAIHISPSIPTNMTSPSAVRVIPHHNFFFFFLGRTLLSSSEPGIGGTFPHRNSLTSPRRNNPGTVGTGVSPIISRPVCPDYSFANCIRRAGSTVCGTPVVENIPCSTPMVDTGSLRNGRYEGTQYFARFLTRAQE